MDNSSELENLISHENNSSGILRTKFSWSVSGNVSNNKGWRQTLLIYPIKSINGMQKIEDFKKFLTELFIRDEDLTNESGIPSFSCEEQYAVDKFKETIIRQPDGRYVIKAIFKKDVVPLKNNYFLPNIRYKSLIESFH